MEEEKEEKRSLSKWQVNKAPKRKRFFLNHELYLLINRHMNSCFEVQK